MQNNNLVTDLSSLLIKMESETPYKLKLRGKYHPLTLTFNLLKFFTKTSYNSFVTTIGGTIYHTDMWYNLSPNEKYVTLKHEAEHLRQFRYWPIKCLGNSKLHYINALLMGFCYIFIAPVLLTFRAKFEREGYRQTLLACWQLGYLDTEANRHNTAVWISDLFGSGTYFYMWTRKKAYDWAIETIKEFDKK